MSNEIKYFVRTTGQRHFDYSPLKTISLYDYKHQAIQSFIEQLEQISEYDAVLLEDDLVLCKNFQEEIEKVINKYPNYIINFFEDPWTYETTFVRSYPFEWNQCTYYPKGVGKQLAAMMRSILHEFPSNQVSYAQIESASLFKLNIPHMIYRPCLVQHNDIKSILWLDGLQRKRTTIWFKDYLDELNISYKDAYTTENVEKLKEVANKHLNNCAKEFEQNKEVLKNE